MRKSRFAESLLKARSKGEITSPSVISLYGVHRVTIEPGSEMKEMFAKTQATLEEINKTLKKLAGKDEQTVQIVKEVLLQALKEPVLEKQETIVKPIEPVRKKLDMRVMNKETPKTPRSPRKQLAWKRFGDSKYLRYREKDGKLFLSYAGSVVETTWDEVERIAKLRHVSVRSEEITKLVGKNAPAQRRAAVSGFIKKVVSGEVSREIDPDAVFRPMLTSYSTRPDPNCGKAEGTLEA